MAEERLAYISNKVLPILKNKWKNVRDIKFEPMTNKTGKEQFQSIAIFGDIVLQTDEKKGVNISAAHKTAEEQNDELVRLLEKLIINKDSYRIEVVIKMQICDQLAMSWTNGGLNFFNEIFFYEKILPYFNSKVGVADIFPEMIYGYYSDQKREDDIIILKNLNTDNYWLTQSKTVQSLEHILIALRKLGRFHACSYILKSLDREAFVKIVNNLKRFKIWLSTDPSHTHFDHFRKSSERPLAFVNQFPEYKKKLAASGYDQFFDNLAVSVTKIYELNEKMSVLCHGDLTRNNMVFKYENRRGSNLNENEIANNFNEDVTEESPIDVKFFDMADIIYGTPVLDLAFFLFLNTSLPMRQTYWEQMLQTYHESIKSECERFTNVSYPSYEDICSEFKIKSMMSFLICSFFLPMMMEEKVKDRSEWTAEPTEEELNEMYSAGGEAATKAVGEILMFILDKGFI